MKEFILIAKGSRANWDAISDDDWNATMEGFNKWINGLKEKNLWGRSGRLTLNRSDLTKGPDGMKISDGPFTETKELTGFFIFNAKDMSQAQEYAKDCPSLLLDTLSLYELEGRPS